nr:DUF4142 domain-containing protein [uncultured Sphingorhabdus sp.]
MKRLIMVSGLIALAGCSGAENANDSAQTDPTTSTASSVPDGNSVAATNNSDAINPTDEASFVAKAGAADLWEVNSSKAALAKSQRADVKKFAQMMVDHHTRTTEKLKSAAASGNIQPSSPQLDAMQQRMLDDINSAQSGTIDAVYLQHQLTAHQAALALHQNYAANGDNDALKKAANEMVGVIKGHIAELQRISSGNARSN